MGHQRAALQLRLLPLPWNHCRQRELIGQQVAAGRVPVRLRAPAGPLDLELQQVSGYAGNVLARPQIGPQRWQRVSRRHTAKVRVASLWRQSGPLCQVLPRSAYRCVIVLGFLLYLVYFFFLQEVFWQ